MRILFAQQATHVEHAGESADRERSATESKEKESIAGPVLSHQVGIQFGDGFDRSRAEEQFGRMPRPAPKARTPVGRGMVPIQVVTGDLLGMVLQRQAVKAQDVAFSSGVVVAGAIAADHDRLLVRIAHGGPPVEHDPRTPIRRPSIRAS